MHSMCYKKYVIYGAAVRDWGVAHGLGQMMLVKQVPWFKSSKMRLVAFSRGITQFTGTSHHLKKRVCPSLRPSIRPSICPLVRPYFFLSIHPSFCTSLFFKSAKTQKIKCILQREIYEFSTDQIDEFVGLDEEEWGSGGVDDQDANNNICRRPPPHYSALWVETLWH